MKLELCLTQGQKKVLNKFIGTARWTYNRCLAKMRETFEKEKRMLSGKELRELCVNKRSLEREETTSWAASSCPAQLRDEALFDLLSAYKSNFSRRKSKKNHLFEIHFRSKKQYNVCTIQAEWITLESPNSFSMLPTFFGKDKIFYVKELLPESFGQYAMKVRKEKNGKWYLHVPLPLSHKYHKTKSLQDHELMNNKDGAPKPKVASIDPGVRTFLAIYSPDGAIVEIGRKPDMEKLYKILKKYDNLQSLLSKARASSIPSSFSNDSSSSSTDPPSSLTDPSSLTETNSDSTSTNSNSDSGSNFKINHRKRNNMKRKMDRLMRKVKNMRSELHRKAVKYLCSNYDMVLLPEFNTSEMVDNTDGKRPLNSLTARKMLTWSHYQFKQLLKNKARESGSCMIHIVKEHHTTMTCGFCGTLNNVGVKEHWKCQKCQTPTERDWNAARNIFLKNHKIISK
jgi:transposase